MLQALLFRLAAAAMAAGLLGGVTANTGHPRSVVLDSLKNNRGRTIATWAQPLWHLGPECGNWPCYPTWAARLIPGTDPHQYTITPPGKRYPWPRFDSKPDQGTPSCPWPGNGGSDSTPFPTYFAVNKCSNTEVRVYYGIFFTKDGTSTNPKGGHDYDWEYAVVVWNLNTQDDMFYRSRIILSRHSKHTYVNWNDIRNTFDNDDDISNNGQKNRNHPKLYVGTSHHAIFHVPSVGPGTCDIVSDWNDITNDDANTAHRGDKWWYMGKGDTLVDGTNTTELGKALQNYPGFQHMSRPSDYQSFFLCSV